MAAYQFDTAEVEDIVLDLLPQIEKSFGFQFESEQLIEVATFGELCAITLDNIRATDSTDCTSQQAFYKLRRILAPHLPGVVIKPTSLLRDILPASLTSRRQLVRAVEAELGFPLQLLGFSSTTVLLILLASLASFATFWIGLLPGISALGLTIIGADLASKFSNTLQMNTMRELTALMTREHYSQSRRRPDTVNRREVVQQIRELFKHRLGIEPDVLTPDARFIKAM